MTTLSELNALRISNGKTELKAWKQSKDKLLQAIEIEMLAERLADEGEGQHPEDVVDRTDPSMPMGENGNELVDELPKPTAEPVSQEATPSDLSDVEGQTVRWLTPIPRGAIGTMSIELLSTTDLPYDEIVARIKAVYPAAKTTARSLASVAMDLRRDGVNVPSRRKPAKAKQAKIEEAAGE